MIEQLDSETRQSLVSKINKLEGRVRAQREQISSLIDKIGRKERVLQHYAEELADLKFGPNFGSCNTNSNATRIVINVLIWADIIILLGIGWLAVR